MLSIAKIIWELSRDSFVAWQEDGGAQLGAALAFYTIISLAPVLIVVIMVAGLVFGEEAAQGEILSQVSGLIGQDGASLVEQMLVKASQPSEGVLASTLGGAALIFGATNVFYQLRQALNRIWGTHRESKGTVFDLVGTRLIAFSTLLGAGFLLLVSLVVSAALSGLESVLESWFIGADILLQLVNFFVSFGVISLLFALLFRVLPNAPVRWRFALLGGAITALLFSLGKFLIGWYLGQSAIGSVYGAAGSVVVLLVWIYYSAQIMLLGAEFTKVYHRRFVGKDRNQSLIEPEEN